MLMQFFRRRRDSSKLFNENYIDAKGLFLYQFDEVCSVSYITNIDVHKAYPYLRELLERETVTIYQHAEFGESDALLFNVSFMVLTEKRIVETGADYIALLHTPASVGWAANLLRDISVFRREREVISKIGFGPQHAMN